MAGPGFTSEYSNRAEFTCLHKTKFLFSGCVRGAIEKPTEMYVYMRDSKVIDFAKSYVDSINVKKAGHAVNEPPTFLYSFAQIFVQALTPYKFLSALGREAEKKARKTER